MADEVGRVLVVGCSSFVSPEDIVKGKRDFHIGHWTLAVLKTP